MMNNAVTAATSAAPQIIPTPEPMKASFQYTHHACQASVHVLHHVCPEQHSLPALDK